MTTTFKTQDTQNQMHRCGVAAALALSNCSISDFSVNIGEIHIEFYLQPPRQIRNLSPRLRPQRSAP